MNTQNKEILKTTDSIDYSKEKPSDIIQAMDNLKKNISETLVKTEEEFMVAKNISLFPEENQEQIVGIINNHINLDKVA